MSPHRQGLQAPFPEHEAFHENLPLDTPQLAGGRKRARRRREPGCTFKRSAVEVRHVRVKKKQPCRL